MNPEPSIDESLVTALERIAVDLERLHRTLIGVGAALALLTVAECVLLIFSR